MINATKIANPSEVNVNIADRNKISQGREEAILTVLNNGLMTTFLDNTFRPKDPVKRKYFAKILDSLLNRFPEVIGLAKKEGIVVGIQEEEAEGNKYTNIIIRNKDNELEIFRYATLVNKLKTGFPVLNGNLMYPYAIQNGMELEFLIKDDKLILATVLNNEQVKHDIVSKALDEEGIDVLQGVVKSNTSEKINTDDEQINRRRIRVELDDDRVVDFVEEKNKLTHIDNDLLVLGEKGFIPAGAVKKDSPITAYVKDNTVLFLKIGSGELRNVSGILRHIEYPIPVDEKNNKNKAGEEAPKVPKPFIKIYTDDNQLLEIPVNEKTGYLVNDNPVGLKDLRVGARVIVTIMRGEASYVMANSYQPPSAYIPKEGKVEFVTIDQVKDKYFTIKESDEKVKVFDGKTIIKKDGETIEFEDLNAGDKVKLYYDDIFIDAPSKIVVAEEPSMVQAVLKGKVVDYSKATGFLNLEEIASLKNSEWSSMPDYLKKYQVDDDTSIYYANNKLSKDDLNPKSGDTVYFVMRNNKLAKIVFTDGSERNFNTSIKKFDNVLNNMILNNGKALSFGEDTIFIENNRVVSKSSLAKGKSLEVYTNYVNGVDTAKLVNILNKEDKIYNKVYFGYIDEVDNYSFTINSYFAFDKMKFTKLSEKPKRLEVFNDSSIYILDKDISISPQDLFHGDYYKKKYKEKGEKKKEKKKGLEYKRYYGVFFVDNNDMLVAAKLRHKGVFENDLLDDRLKREKYVAEEMTKIKDELSYSRGYIDKFIVDWQRVSLKDSYNYFAFDKKWKLNDEQTVLILKDALIIKNDKAISYEDLRIDDKVYAIRYDEKVLFLYVEE